MPLKLAKSGVLMFQIRSGVVVFLNSVFHFCFKMKLKLVCSYVPASMLVLPSLPIVISTYQHINTYFCIAVTEFSG